MTGDEPRYRPRKHDHLVEPMFGGLGVGAQEPLPGEAQARGGLRPLRRLWRALLRFLRLSRPASGP